MSAEVHFRVTSATARTTNDVTVTQLDNSYKITSRQDCWNRWRLTWRRKWIGQNDVVRFKLFQSG